MSEANPGHPNLRAPFRAGENHNPKGVNQFTYRDEAKKHFAKLCKENADGFLEEVFRLAREGESWAAKMVWDEIMPAIKTVDLNVNDGREPVVVPVTDERVSALAELAAEVLH